MTKRFPSSTRHSISEHQYFRDYSSIGEQEVVIDGTYGFFNIGKADKVPVFNSHQEFENGRFKTLDKYNNSKAFSFANNDIISTVKSKENNFKRFRKSQTNIDDRLKQGVLDKNSKVSKTTVNKVKKWGISSDLNQKTVCAEQGVNEVIEALCSTSDSNFKTSKPSEDQNEEYQNCRLCGRLFKNASFCSQHLKVVHKAYRYQCLICKKNFHFSTLAMNHVKISHIGIWKSKNKLSNVGDFVKVKVKTKSKPIGGLLDYYKTKLKRITKARKKVYFNAIVKKDSFMWCVMGQNKFILKHQCKRCRRRFNNHSDFYQHMKMEYLGLRFQCTFCDQPFWTCYAVKRHIKNEHTHLFGVWNNNSKFPLKNRRSSSKASSSNDITNNGDQRRSNASASRPMIAIRSNQKATVSSSFGCDFCSKTFFSQNGCHNHMNKEHFGWCLKCTLCDTVFKYHKGLYEHLRLRHCIKKNQGQYYANVRFERLATSDWEDYVKKQKKCLKTATQRCNGCLDMFEDLEALKEHMLNSISCLNSAHVCLVPETEQCQRKVSSLSKVNKKNVSHTIETELVSPSSACITKAIPLSNAPVRNVAPGRINSDDVELGVYDKNYQTCSDRRSLKRCLKRSPTKKKTVAPPLKTASSRSPKNPKTLTVDEDKSINYYAFAVPADLLKKGSLTILYTPFERQESTIRALNNGQISSNVPITCTPVVDSASIINMESSAQHVREIFSSSNIATVSASNMNNVLNISTSKVNKSGSGEKLTALEIAEAALPNITADNDCNEVFAESNKNLSDDDYDEDECIEVSVENSSLTNKHVLSEYEECFKIPPTPTILRNSVISLNERHNVSNQIEQQTTSKALSQNREDDLPILPTVSNIYSLSKPPAVVYGKDPAGRYILRPDHALKALLMKVKQANYSDDAPQSALLPNVIPCHDYLKKPRHFDHSYNTHKSSQQPPCKD